MAHGDLVVGLSVLGALLFATSSSLKHRSAHAVPAVEFTSGRAAGRFVRATIGHPLWILGIVFDTAGLVCQVCALHFGALAIVQPLMLTGLIFALVLPTGHRRVRLGGQEFGWALLVCACLGTLLVLTRTPNVRLSSDSTDRLPAVLSAIAGAGFVLVAAVTGHRKRKHVFGGAILGAAVGTIYAATAALLKALSDVAVRSVPAVFGSWQLYAVVAAGAAGLFLSQLAFQAGPLTGSLPAMATVDPLLSIAIGVVIFDEHIRTGAGGGVGLLVLLLLLILGVVRLSRLGAVREQLAIGGPLAEVADRPTTYYDDVGDSRHEGLG